MADETTTRRCIGSARFEIEPHEAPVEDFPRQPSQKDGLGRMCKTHWNQYTAGLARNAKARKAAEGDVATRAVPTEAAAGSRRGRTGKQVGAPRPEPMQTRSPRRGRAQTPVGGSQGDGR